jgi:hypothetical protein
MNIPKTILWAILAALCCTTAHAVDTRRCTATESADILVVGGLLDAEIQNIANQLTFLSQRNRDELVCKWPKIKVRCRERFACCIADLVSARIDVVRTTSLEFECSQTMSADINPSAFLPTRESARTRQSPAKTNRLIRSKTNWPE